MGEDDKDLDNVLNVNTPQDDFDVYDDADPSIHPLTIKGGEEDQYYLEGFNKDDDLNKDG